MNKHSFTFGAVLIAALASMAFADDTKKKVVVKGEKPKASPSWVVI